MERRRARGAIRRRKGRIPAHKGEEEKEVEEQAIEEDGYEVKEEKEDKDKKEGKEPGEASAVLQHLSVWL